MSDSIESRGVMGCCSIVSLGVRGWSPTRRGRYCCSGDLCVQCCVRNLVFTLSSKGCYTSDRGSGSSLSG
jgi:hypothetical protein